MRHRILCAELFCSLLLISAPACTSVDTSMTAPTATRCQLALASTPASFGPSGGTGAVNVTTTRDCTWSITAVPAWVSVPGALGGQGEAIVSYTVASNPAAAPRSGSISVGTTSVQINQEPAPCRFELDRGAQSVGAAGAHVAVQVSTLTGCAWSVRNDVPWVVISSGTAGSSSGTVSLEIAANSGPDRLATLTIAGQTFTVRQSAIGQSATPPQVTPPSPTPTEETVEGRAKSVKGHCPNLTFTISGRTVVTSRDTVFEGTACRDVERDDLNLRVTGTARPSGTIDAARVLKTGDGHD